MLSEIKDKNKFRLIAKIIFLMVTLNFLFHFNIVHIYVEFCIKCIRPFLISCFYMLYLYANGAHFRKYQNFLICKMPEKCRIVLWNRRFKFCMCHIYDKRGFSFMHQMQMAWCQGRKCGKFPVFCEKNRLNLKVKWVPLKLSK